MGWAGSRLARLHLYYWLPDVDVQQCCTDLWKNCLIDEADASKFIEELEETLFLFQEDKTIVINPNWGATD